MQRYTGTAVVVSTNAALPSATITVFDTGTLTPAVIWQDAAGTVPQNNPFTADATSGVFSFCAANGTYDILVEKTGAVSYTLSQVTLNAGAVDAEYLLGAAESALASSRIPVDTTTLAWDLTTPGAFAASVIAGSIGLTQLASLLAKIRYWPVSIAHAAIVTSPAVPVEIVAAPGAGIRRVVLFAYLTNNFAAGAYGNIDTNGYGYLSHTGNELTSLCTAYIGNSVSDSLTFFTTFMGSTTPQDVILLPYQNAKENWGLLTNPAARAAMVNAPIYWTVSNTGNFSGGNAANTISGFVLTLDWTVAT